MRLRPDHPLQLVLGLPVWFGWFVAIYAGLSIGCEAATPQTARGWFVGMGLGLGALTLAVVTYFCRAGLACRRAARAGVANRRFIAGAAAALHASAVVATVFVALVFVAVPLAWLPPCL